MAQATVKDLADQLTEMSDKFVASFTETMKVEDDLTAFLRGRQRWYVGTTQQDSAPGAEPQTEATPDKLAEAAEPKKKKCLKSFCVNLIVLYQKNINYHENVTDLTIFAPKMKVPYD